MSSDVFAHINWLAVLVAGLAWFFLGAMWYSKLLFAKPWIKATAINMEDPNLKTGMAQIMLTSLVLMIISCLGLAIFLAKMPLVNWMTGAKAGLVAALCFCVPAISISYLYEKRPLILHLINGGYNVVGALIAGIILGAWR